jgi:hypothetical protein
MNEQVSTRIVREFGFGMPALVRYGRRKAIFRDGRWLSSNSALEDQLNAETDQWISATGGPAVHDAEPERTTARTIAERTGGRFTTYIRPRGAASRHLFLARRQMRMEF